MEEHFKLVDYAKQLLFNSKTTKQEDEAIKMLNALKIHEETIYIK